MAWEFYITPTDYLIAEKNGISYDLLNGRIRNMAWDKQRAITTPPRTKDRYGKWLKIAQDHGVCRDTLRSRKLRGWDMEKAATTKPMTSREVVAYMQSKIGVKA